ncbi:MAG: type II secretion system protein [Deltaproteobacteria bacterium]|nr:type II secretion system protein [Deltaproteobacteria bacterium]
MIFHYRAVDPKGTEAFGEIEAISEAQAVRNLRVKNLTVIELNNTENDQIARAPKKASLQELTTSFHELVTLLESDVSVSDTLDSQCLANYPQDLSKSYNKMAEVIRAGGSFSLALEKSGLKLPPYFSQLSKAGELAGDLPRSLRNGLNQFEYEQRLGKDFKAALTYPLILVSSGVAAILLIFIVVVPKFLPMLEKSDDMPLLSEVIFGAGIFFNDNWLFVILCVLGLAIGLQRVLRNPDLKASAYDVALRLPLIGTWLLEIDVARWCSLFGTMLVSKVDLVQALALASEGVRSKKRRARFMRCIVHVKSGVSLADSLEKEAVLTPVGYNLIRSGEKSGKLADMALSLGTLYNDAGQNRMKHLLGLLEPLSILIVGVFIGLIVLGVMLAITSVNMGGF